MAELASKMEPGKDEPPVLVADTYEARQRSQIVSPTEQTGTVVTNKSLANRQAGLAKKAHDATVLLTAAQKTRRDKTITRIHRQFQEVGRDADSCGVCADVTNLCVRLFLRASSHALLCSQCDPSLSSSMECPAALMFQPASVLAPACVSFFLASECESHVQTMGTTAFEKLRQDLNASSIFGALARSPSQTRAQDVMTRSMAWLLTSTEADITKPCEVKQLPPPSISEADSARFAGILQSAAAMGWVTPENCDAAMCRLESPAFHSFRTLSVEWPIDLAAMALLVATGADREAVRLSKLCARANLSETTVDRALAVLAQR